MTKKKFAARLLCAALALVMCLGLTVTAFAQDETPVTEAMITKILEMDENVTKPDETFNFSVTKVSLDEKMDAASLAAMPDITVAGLSVNGGAEAVDGGKRMVTIRTDNLIPSANTFPHAGVYVYSVAETPGSNSEITYSNASYDLKIFVINGPDGLQIGGVEVSTEDGKVTPPPPGPGETTKANMEFINIYVPSGGDPDDPDAKALTVSNVVTGNLGDKTREFTYELTITKLPAVVDPNAVYTCTVHKADGSTETVELKLNEKATFALADGEYLDFDSLPVGTVYTVSMEYDATYDMTLKVVSGGAEETITVDDAGKATKTNVMVGEGTNSVTGTYHKEDIVPGGVFVNNLPFILLILVALCGFTGYIVYNRKKHHN